MLGLHSELLSEFSVSTGVKGKVELRFGVSVRIRAQFTL